MSEQPIEQTTEPTNPDIKHAYICLVTGEGTNFRYRGKPVKREIYDLAKQLRKDYLKKYAKPVTVGQCLDEIAEHIKVEFQKKIKDYKQELEKEVEELEKENENGEGTKHAGRPASCEVLRETKEQGNKGTVLEFTKREHAAEN